MRFPFPAWPRHTGRLLVVALLLLAAGVAAWVLRPPPVSEAAVPGESPMLEESLQALLPLPAVPALPPAKVELGRRLFAEPRLSADDSISCASCHDLARGGADGRTVSLGVRGRGGTRNAPTVFNASLNFVQFWDGRAAGLEQQVAGPVHNPVEMASNWADVVAKLGADAGYAAAFRAAYPDGLTAANVADAIASFEKTLLTPTRFDQFLRGNRQALDAREQAGLERFLSYGCASCHQGAGLGGNMYQRFGVMDDAEAQEGARDAGRFAVTARAEDRGVFKVPGLRNVALTAPYFHDGSVATLEEAVKVMGRVQLGRRLSQEDVELIVAFLRTLNGQWQGRWLE